MNRRTKGITLVELLIAMALIGVVLAGIGSAVVSTLRFSSVSQSSSERIRELTNATGYVVDKVRGSSVVGDCDGTGSTCISVDLPEVDGIRLTGNTTSLEYAIVDRSSLDPTWVEATEGGGFALVERRGAQTFLVLDHLTAASSVEHDGTDDTVELSFQVQRDSATGSASTPADGTYDVVVTPRN